MFFNYPQPGETALHPARAVQDTSFCRKHKDTVLPWLPFFPPPACIAPPSPLRLSGRTRLQDPGFTPSREQQHIRHDKTVVAK